MSNQNTAPKAELAVIYEANGEQIKLTPKIVQDYIVGEGGGTITLPEFKFFTELCKVRKLNPFLKEAYCIKFGSNPAQIVVGKDAILKRAIINPDFDGMQSGIIVQKPDGTVEERNGTFHLPDEKLVGGWSKVFRKNWKYPTYSSVSFDEVSQKKKDGTLNQNWATKGATMVEKVAKVRALRETFIEDLQGMYEADEMNIPQADSAPTEQIEPVIIEQVEPVPQEAAEQPQAVSFNDL